MREKNTPDITYAVQVASSLLGPWSSVPGSVEQLWKVVDNGTTQTITARDQSPVASAPSRFMRLRITR